MPDGMEAKRCMTGNASDRRVISLAFFELVGMSKKVELVCSDTLGRRAGSL